MRRSTQAQKAVRLNAAQALLAEGTSMAEAAVALVQAFDLSRRQAYRYLEEARALGRAVPVPEEPVAITLKLPADVVRDLRREAAQRGVPMGTFVARAVRAYLAGGREHG